MRSEIGTTGFELCICKYITSVLFLFIFLDVFFPWCVAVCFLPYLIWISESFFRKRNIPPLFSYLVDPSSLTKFTNHCFCLVFSVSFLRGMYRFVNFRKWLRVDTCKNVTNQSNVDPINWRTFLTVIFYPCAGWQLKALHCALIVFLVFFLHTF